MIKYILVFLAMFIADVLWALYFISVEKRKALPASVYGCLIYLMGGYTIMQYTQEPKMMIPAILGAFLGTYITVKYKKEKDGRT